MDGKETYTVEAGSLVDKSCQVMGAGPDSSGGKVTQFCFGLGSQ